MRVTSQDIAPAASSSFGIPSRARLSVLLGSSTALSLPVIAAFFIVGYVVSLSYLRLVMIDSWLTAGIEALLTLIIPCGFLLIVRAVRKSGDAQVGPFPRFG